MIFGRGNDKAENTREETVGAQGASTAKVKLDMGVGHMRVGGGANNLMDAHFEYNDGLEPKVSYEVRGDRGELRVNQPSFLRSFKATRNRWDIRLGDTIPLDLEIENGAGEASIDASSLPLTTFQLDQSAGEVEARVNGDQLRLRKVDVEIAAGRLDMEMRGAYPVLREMKVETAAGQVRLDLTGTWIGEVDIKVEVVAGEAIVRLPRNVNVIATADTTVGRVKVRGLNNDGNGYRLDVPGANGLLRVKAVANVGQVVLEVVD